jgi:hypothetical protein
MAAEGHPAMLEVAGERDLARGGVAVGEQPGEREGRVVAGEDPLERRRGRQRAAGRADEQPPQRPQQQPAQEEAGAQLNTTTPRATCPVRSAVKPSLIWSSE